MPLPETGTGLEWPPASHQQALSDMQVNDAWYSGDIDALETLYATSRLIRKSSIWGQVQRRFYGTPVPGQQAQRPVKLHLPIPAEIARISSQILYGEMPKIAFEDLDQDGDTDSGEDLPETIRHTMNTRLTDILDDSVHAALLEGGELGAALGGNFLRVTWNQSVVPDKPFITAVAADAAIADFRYQRLTGVTFWTDLAPINGTPGTFRLLERHDPGRVEWGLYHAMTTGQLGTRVPLTEHPYTASLADVVDGNSGVETGSDLLTAVYIPNVKPQRLRRKDPVASNYGRSDYEGVEDLFDAFDETYTAWMRDIRLGKSRIFASPDIVDTGTPGQGAYFDADKEVFVPVKKGPGALASPTGGSSNGANYVQAQQFTIRWQEHQATAQAILEQIFIAAGYAPATFGLDSGHTRTVTATEVQAREKLTMLTRGAKLLYAKPEIQRLVAALMDVDKHVFNGPGRDGVLPEVQFPDAAAPSIDALAQTLQLLFAAQSASIETRVQMLNPDWEPDQVAVEVEKIIAEMSSHAPALPDPASLTGADFAADGPDGTDGYPGDQYSAADGSTGPGVGQSAGSGGGGGSQ